MSDPAFLFGSVVTTLFVLAVGWWLVYEYAIKVLMQYGALEISEILKFQVTSLKWWKYLIAFAFDILIIIIAIIGTIWIIGRLIEERDKAGKWWKYYHSEEAKKDIWIKRWGRWQKVQHFWVMITFILCAVTGMWAHYVNDYITRQMLLLVHVGAGLAMMLLVVVHFVYYLVKAIAYKAKGYSLREKFPMLEFYSIRYFKNFIKALIHPFYPKIKPEPYGKYDPEQLFEYWGVYWGMAVLGIPGLILLFAGPHVLDGIFWVTHVKEAVLAISFILMVHIAHAHLRPSVFPMDLTYLVGYMPMKRIEEEHGRWAEELKRKLGLT